MYRIPMVVGVRVRSVAGYLYPEQLLYGLVAVLAFALAYVPSRSFALGLMAAAVFGVPFVGSFVRVPSFGDTGDRYLAALLAYWARGHVWVHVPRRVEGAGESAPIELAEADAGGRVRGRRVRRGAS